ncbi:MAG: hypothetical protein QM762_04950 [Chryseolinea sp.]
MLYLLRVSTPVYAGFLSIVKTIVEHEEYRWINNKKLTRHSGHMHFHDLFYSLPVVTHRSVTLSAWTINA